VVADGTRAITIETTLDIKRNLQKNYPDVPFIILFNKYDLLPQWKAEQAQIKKIKAEGIKVIQTSAKTGTLVQETFEELGRLILKNNP
jgi:signal recognition particle receptor subunit beta